MIQVALVGGTHIHTPGFVKRLNARTDVKVAAVWDPNADTAQRRAKDLNAPVVADLSAILADVNIRGVVVCSETNRHEELVVAAAKAKKHLFVEKPLGFAAADAYRMAKAIEDAGVIFQTGYFNRGNAQHLFIREQIKAGAFGKITRARGSNCHTGSLGGWFDTEWRWMADPKIAGCGAFGDLGTHSLDLLMWLLGEPESVAAHIGVATGRYGDCDEYGEALLRFPGGLVATLAAGWVDHANPVPLLISGTEGHAHIHNGQLFFKSTKVEGADGKEPWTKLPEAWPHAFELYLDALHGKDVSLVGVREAAARNAAMEACYRASKEGTWVTPAKG